MELNEKSLEDMIKLVAEAEEAREMKIAILPTKIFWPSVRDGFEKEYSITSDSPIEYEHVKIHEFFDTEEEAQEYADILQSVMEGLATEYFVYVRQGCTVTRNKDFIIYEDWVVTSDFCVDTKSNSGRVGLEKSKYGFYDDKISLKPIASVSYAYVKYGSSITIST